jgi:polyisoprenoid-binding protein YceI
MKNALPVAILALMTGSAVAAPATYNIDPAHTHPSFQADHMGLSYWRGKFNRSTGTIVLDKDKGSGTVEITVDTRSIDFGLPKLNEHVKSPDQMLDAEKFPTATYKGTLVKFKDGAPTEVQGQLTLHGVTKPLTLTINQFKCVVDPFSKKEKCGADASGTFNRSDFGVNWGATIGFGQEVKLEIQVEALHS